MFLGVHEIYVLCRSLEFGENPRQKTFAAAIAAWACATGDSAGTLVACASRAASTAEAGAEGKEAGAGRRWWFAVLCLWWYDDEEETRRKRRRRRRWGRNVGAGVRGRIAIVMQCCGRCSVFRGGM